MTNILQAEAVTKTNGRKGEKQYQVLKGISFNMKPSLSVSWARQVQVRRRC